MDSMGWDGSPVATNPPSLWSNQQHDSEESLILSNFNTSVYGGKMDLTEAIFNQIQELQRSQPSQLNPNTSEGQDAARLVAKAMLAKSGDGSCWGESSDQELYSSLIKKDYSTTPIMADFSMGDQSRIMNGIPNSKVGPPTGSLESLDCLLSASNSNTDTSVEDDGISTIFSDCSILWNFGGTNAADSSGESENNTCNTRNKKMHYPLSDIDEAVSQGSSDQFANHRKCSQPKSVSRKRNDDQSDFKASVKFPPFDLLKTDCSTTEGGFRLISENPPKPKKPRSEKHPSSSNINFQQSISSMSSSIEEPDPEAIAQMKEMIYRAAAFRPVSLGLEVVEKPKRKNVRISTDPQTVAARQRRERISDRIRVLQKLVPGGNKMDTASMLDEAANYLRFLRSQVKALENRGHKLDSVNGPPPTTIAFSSLPFNHSFPMQNHFPLLHNPNHFHHP